MVDGGLGYLVATFTLRGKLANANFSLGDFNVQIYPSRVHLMKSIALYKFGVGLRIEVVNCQLRTADSK
jgi:hypothetical protein